MCLCVCETKRTALDILIGFVQEDDDDDVQRSDVRPQHFMLDDDDDEDGLPRSRGRVISRYPTRSVISRYPTLKKPRIVWPPVPRPPPPRPRPKTKSKPFSWSSVPRRVASWFRGNPRRPAFPPPSEIQYAPGLPVPGLSQDDDSDSGGNGNPFPWSEWFNNLNGGGDEGSGDDDGGGMPNPIDEIGQAPSRLKQGSDKFKENGFFSKMGEGFKSLWPPSDDDDYNDNSLTIDQLMKGFSGQGAAKPVDSPADQVGNNSPGN